MPNNGSDLRLGWVGLGRMGAALATRLLDGGSNLAVYNRTAAKCEPLAARGAAVVGTPRDLADRDVVFTMVATPADLREVLLGPNGVLADPDKAPRIIVDSTTVSVGAGEELRAAAAERGVVLLAAPVSGNPSVVASGRLTMVVSGPEAAFNELKPYLELLVAGLTYVGDGERARLVKICHNIMLGVVSQSLAEITVLAEKGGVSRADFLAFLNDSVMGSVFTRYKTPAFVNLDFTPTFTPALLLKDFKLGVEAADQFGGVPMPVAAAAQEVVVSLIGHGYHDIDFAALLELEAKGAGITLESENADVSDGLESPAVVS